MRQGRCANKAGGERGMKIFIYLSEAEGVPWMALEGCVVFDKPFNLSEPVSTSSMNYKAQHLLPGPYEAKREPS